jgi:hypothetical protein
MGAPELSSSGIGSIAHTLVVPDSIDLERLFEPFAGQDSDPDQYGPCGAHSCDPIFGQSAAPVVPLLGEL